MKKRTKKKLTKKLNQKTEQLIHKINEAFNKAIKSGDLSGYEKAFLELKDHDPKVAEEVIVAYLWEIHMRAEEIEHYARLREGLH